MKNLQIASLLVAFLLCGPGTNKGLTWDTRGDYCYVQPPSPEEQVRLCVVTGDMHGLILIPNPI